MGGNGQAIISQWINQTLFSSDRTSTTTEREKTALKKNRIECAELMYAENNGTIPALSCLLYIPSISSPYLMFACKLNKHTDTLIQTQEDEHI